MWYILLLSSSNSEPVIEHFLEQADTYHYFAFNSYINTTISEQGSVENDLKSFSWEA